MKRLNVILSAILLTVSSVAWAQIFNGDTLFINESVVVGMDVQKRNTITASVSVVKSDAVSSRPVTDLANALQGNVAGLNFRQMRWKAVQEGSRVLQ